MTRPSPSDGPALELCQVEDLGGPPVEGDGSRYGLQPGSGRRAEGQHRAELDRLVDEGPLVELVGRPTVRQVRERVGCHLELRKGEQSSALEVERHGGCSREQEAGELGATPEASETGDEVSGHQRGRSHADEGSGGEVDRVVPLAQGRRAQLAEEGTSDRPEVGRADDGEPFLGRGCGAFGASDVRTIPRLIPRSRSSSWNESGFPSIAYDARVRSSQSANQREVDLTPIFSHGSRRSPKPPTRGGQVSAVRGWAVLSSGQLDAHRSVLPPPATTRSRSVLRRLCVTSGVRGALPSAAAGRAPERQAPRDPRACRTPRRRSPRARRSC